MPVTPELEGSKLQPLKRCNKSRSGPVHGKVSMYYSDTGDISVKDGSHVWKRDPNRMVPVLPRINKEGYQSTFTGTSMNSKKETMSVNVVQKYKQPVGIAKPCFENDSNAEDFEKTTPWLPPPSSQIPLPLPKQQHTYMTEGGSKTSRGGGFGSINQHYIFSGVSSGLVAAQITQAQKKEEKETTGPVTKSKAKKPFLNTLPMDFESDSSKVMRIDSQKRQASSILSKHQAILLEPIKRNYQGDWESLQAKDKSQVLTKKPRKKDITTVDVADFSRIQSEYSLAVFEAHANSLNYIGETYVDDVHSYVVEELPDVYTKSSKHAAVHRQRLVGWLFSNPLRPLFQKTLDEHGKEGGLSPKWAGTNTSLLTPVCGHSLSMQYPMCDFQNHRAGIPVTSADIEDLLDVMPDGSLLIRILQVLQRQSWKVISCAKLTSLLMEYIETVYNMIPSYREAAIKQNQIDETSINAVTDKQWFYLAVHLPMEYDELIFYFHLLADTSARFTSIYALTQALTGLFNLRRKSSNQRITSVGMTNTSLLASMNTSATDTDEGLLFLIIRQYRFQIVSAIESEVNRRKGVLEQRGIDLQDLVFPRSLVFSLDMFRQMLELVRSQDDLEELYMVDNVSIPCNEEYRGVLGDNDMYTYDGGLLHTFSSIWNLFRSPDTSQAQFILLPKAARTSTLFSSVHSRIIFLIRLLLNSSPFTGTVMHRYEEKQPYLKDLSLDYASTFFDLLHATVLILRELVASMQFYFNKPRYNNINKNEDKPNVVVGTTIFMHALDYLGAGLFGGAVLIDYLDVCARKNTYTRGKDSKCNYPENGYIPIYYEGGCYTRDHEEKNLSLTFGYEEKALLDARCSPNITYTHKATDTFQDIVYQAKAHFEYIHTASMESNNGLYGAFGNGMRACVSFDHILSSLAKEMPFRAPPVTPYQTNRVVDPTNEHFYVLQKSIPLVMQETLAILARVDSKWMETYQPKTPQVSITTIKGQKVLPTVEVSILDQTNMLFYGFCSPFHISTSVCYTTDIGVQPNQISMLKDVEWSLEYLPQQAHLHMFSRIIKMLKMRRHQSMYQIVTALGQRALEPDSPTEEDRSVEEEEIPQILSLEEIEASSKLLSTRHTQYSLPKLNVTKYNLVSVSNPPSPLAPVQATPDHDLPPVLSSVDFFDEGIPQAPTKKPPAIPPGTEDIPEMGSPTKKAPKPPTNTNE